MEKYIFNTKDIITPREGYVVYLNRYWMCVDGDPTKALFYGNSPQCNSDKRINDKSITSDFYTNFSPNLQNVFVEIAFVPRRD